MIQKKKIFGIDRWNKSETTYVTEGPLDSLFLKNAISSCGGDIVSAIKNFPKENMIVVYDNEPRSPTIKRKC